MRGVHGDDTFGEVEAAVGVFVMGHYGAQVGHRFAVFLAVGYCGQRGAWAWAIIEGDGRDVCPCGRGGVFAHCVRWREGRGEVDVEVG